MQFSGSVLDHGENLPRLRIARPGLNDALTMPGIAKAWTMPIKARIDMLTTGVRTPLGIKVRVSDHREASVTDMPGKVVSMYSSVPSSSGGINPEPRLKNTGTVSTIGNDSSGNRLTLVFQHELDYGGYRYYGAAQRVG